MRQIKNINELKVGECYKIVSEYNLIPGVDDYDREPLTISLIIPSKSSETGYTRKDFANPVFMFLGPIKESDDFGVVITPTAELYDIPVLIDSQKGNLQVILKDPENEFSGIDKIFAIT